MKGNKKPLVSICVPTYNGEAYIKEALQSIIEQTYNSIEVIISDDNSIDNTLFLVEEFKKICLFNILVVKNFKNGIGNNWNNCVRNSNGKYIKFLFQDDVLKPTCIEEMVNVAEKDSEIGLVYSKRTILYDEFNSYQANWVSLYKNIYDTWKNNKLNIEGIHYGKSFLKDENLLNSPKNKIGEPSAVLIKKECFAKIGYFDENLKQLIDFEFWLRIMKKYKLGMINKELVFFRLHDDQASFVNLNSDTRESSQLSKIIYKKYFYLVSNKTKFFLLKKYNPCFKTIIKIIKYLKR